MKHGRGQVQYAELAVSRDGRFNGLKVRLVVDGGAYGGEADLAEITLKMAPGVYDIPNYEASADVVLTNKVPMGAYRGAGRPEACYLIERAINIASAKLKLDPVKVRQLNYIEKERFPFGRWGATPTTPATTTPASKRRSGSPTTTAYSPSAGARGTRGGSWG